MWGSGNYKPMKVYADYNGVEPPTGVVVIEEGPIARIFFDHERVGEQIVCENVDVGRPLNYARVVSAIVRDRFSADAVEAILANHAEGTHQEDYDAYQAWRAKAKEIAHIVMREE